jgi:hypothetical protein
MIEADWMWAARPARYRRKYSHITQVRETKACLIAFTDRQSFNCYRARTIKPWTETAITYFYPLDLRQAVL